VSAVVKGSSGQDRLWAVVLAGGEGTRLRPLGRLVCGDDRPKQYLPLLGERTLLRQTLDRIALGIPVARTVVVTLGSHSRYFAGQFAGAAAQVLVQPADRGTAAGILFPTQWVAWRDPDATVAVFPSDHFVLEEATFMAHVAGVAGWVDQHPDWLVLLGARPTEPETEYGWIELGAPLGHGPGIWEVRRFWEKPSEEIARVCLEAGCLWNTLVLVGKVATLLRAGQAALPEMGDRLARIAPFLGTEDEAWAVRQAYGLMPPENFSRSVLEACPPSLAVSRLPAVLWSDLGNPYRVFQLLRRVGTAPPWARALGLSA
jgi:mannose-1-phosphate guanylyltransferase